jgi:RNA polymerase sigma-70 factor (ECF subfamily)
MTDASHFEKLVRRIRAGDQAAAAELIAQYEPLIRREVRLHLEDRRLYRLFDSMDVCQSVLGSFFLRAAAGQYDLEKPDQIVRLLITMTRNKLASAARQHHRQRRDQRRVSGDGQDHLAGVASPDPRPDSAVASEELLRRFREELNDEERKLVDLRRDGKSWADVAEELGGTPGGRRMQLSRAVERVVRTLGLEPSDI